MLIKRARGWEIPGSEATPESVFLSRRQLVGGGAAVAGATALGPFPAAAQLADPTFDLYPAKRNDAYKLDREITAERFAADYNNFYEFGSSKTVAAAARALKVRPWTVKVDGLVEKPFEIGIDELIRKMPIEERLYRLRCVEAWAMAVPLTGFAIKAFLELAKLPACTRDGSAIARVLQTESRFDDVLVIDSETISTSVKHSLISFFKKHEQQEIGDIFFYFSGHGEFTGDEIYYLLSDYNSRRRKQTSLENSELDSLARALKPNVFVKMVDACQSRILYIKSPDEFDEYLRKGVHGGFKNIHFMYSSQGDQSSYQDKDLSFLRIV